MIPRRAVLPLAMLLPVLLLSSCGIIGTAIKLIPLKLIFSCLPEGTLIDTPSGPRAVESIRPGDTVTGFGGSPVRVLQTHGYAEDMNAARFLRISFENGSVVDLCGPHRIDGIPAADLRPGARAGGQVVASIETYAGVERSYDLLTEDAGYRIGGVAVNSMIEEMYEAGRKGHLRDGTPLQHLRSF